MAERVSDMHKKRRGAISRWSSLSSRAALFYVMSIVRMSGGGQGDMARDLKYRNRHVALVSFLAAAGMVGMLAGLAALRGVLSGHPYGGTTQTAERL